MRQHELAGDLVGVAMENNQLRDDKKTLAEQIAELQTESQRLLAELAGMTTEVERLTELVAAYRSVQIPTEQIVDTAVEPADDAVASIPDDSDESVEISPTSTEEPTPAWTIPGDYLRRADLEAAAKEVTSELRSLESRVAQLEVAAVALADLEKSLRTGVGDGISPTISVKEQPGTLLGSGVSTEESDSEASDSADTAVAVEPAADAEERSISTESAERVADSTASASPDEDAGAAADEAERAAAEAERAAAESASKLAAVTAELAALVLQNEELRRATLELENKILKEILSNGLVALMSERMTDTIHTGFVGSEPDVGEWTVTDSRAVQTDSGAYFAKLAIPAVQSERPVLYSFSVRTLDPQGWVGVGLHFFVSDVDKRRGYGLGKSLLVWLTRDPDVYKTQLTYLQLYRSDDDVTMGRVLDAVVEEPISDFLNVEVLYEPDKQYVTVAIGGEDKVRYRTWFGIDTGVEVALRSLGAAEFTNFQVRTEPAESASLPPSGAITW